jgi:urease accessory protein
MKRLVAMLIVLAAASPAHAHVGHDPTSSLMAGFVHPFGGLDHLAAMVAVGLWAQINGGRKVWIWPAAFVAMMLVGASIGIAGIAAPYVEPVIAASVVVLGILAAVALRAPTWAGAALVALFASAHGYAHGTELSGAVVPAYMAGFAVATATLHAAGILIARMGHGIAGLAPARLAGASTAVLGLALVVRG